MSTEHKEIDSPKMITLTPPTMQMETFIKDQAKQDRRGKGPWIICLIEKEMTKVQAGG